MTGRKRVSRKGSIYAYYLRLTVAKGVSTSYVHRLFQRIVKRCGFEYKAVVSAGHGEKNFDRPHVHAIVLSSRSISRRDLLRRVPDGVHVRFSRITDEGRFVEIDSYIDDHVRPHKGGRLVVSRFFGDLVRRVRFADS